MKTAYSIYLDYQKALRDAAALEHTAGDIRKEKNRMAARRNDIAAEWAGEASDEFVDKLIETEERLGTLEREVLKAAEIIRRTAASAYRAEKKAIDLASRRTY